MIVCSGGFKNLTSGRISDHIFCCHEARSWDCRGGRGGVVLGRDADLSLFPFFLNKSLQGLKFWLKVYKHDPGNL